MGYSVKYDPLQNSIVYDRTFAVKTFDCTAGQTIYPCDVYLTDDYVMIADGSVLDAGHTNSGINVVYAGGLPEGTRVLIVY